MDATMLSQYLTPCMPFLLRMGEETAKAIAKKVGEDGWQKTRETASALWDRIYPKAHEDSNLIKSAQDVATAQEGLSVLPEGEDLKPASEELEDYQKIFARRLKTLLDANPELATFAQTTVEQMVRIEGEAGDIRMIAKREGSTRQGVVVGPTGKTSDISMEA
jgi:hypothetical protein